MANKSTSLNARNKSGSELSYQLHETDSPILPVAQLERLAKFKPEAVQWIIEQTQIEAEHRRKEQSKINFYTFMSVFFGQIFGFCIGLAGIVFGSIVAIYGQPFAGAAIASVAIGSLAVVFITGRIPDTAKESQQAQPDNNP